MKKIKITFLSSFMLLLLQNCGTNVGGEENVPLPLFSSLTADQTGIKFNNLLTEDGFHNILRFDYMYNGGGIAAGDFDGDNDVDLYFSGNMVDNKLYINNGGFQFADITEKAGVGTKGRWCTGVTTVDINQDGLLDIYVCCSGNGIDDLDPRNLLYVNNGNLTFTENAARYGLADPGNSMMASFFDYDRDGDLDVYLANRPAEFYLDQATRHNNWKDPPSKSTNRLYRNDGDGIYVDITAGAGLLSYDYSLGIVTGDLNGDNWPDIYVANDYQEPDRFYENLGNGTYSNTIELHLRHTSNFGMGVDLADINNDALPDLLELDMVARDNYRQKTQMSAMNPEQFWASVAFGYHYQYMRNALQLNQGGGLFSEIGQLAGVANTDWSWAPLLADFDNDGWKDLIVTNGFRRDARNADSRKKVKAVNASFGGKHTPEDLLKLLESIPVNKIPNYYFRNNGDLTFTDLSDASGFAIPSFSNGAVYADLDNDGDLDVAINNLMDPAFIFRNNTMENGGKNYLKIKFNGPAGNRQGIGTKVKLRAGGIVQSHELLPTRGYQSCMEPILHFGLGGKSTVEEIEISWFDGSVQVLKNVSVNRVLTVSHKDAAKGQKGSFDKEVVQLFRGLQREQSADFLHRENEYDDYEKEVLLPHKMSRFGPHLSVGDVNNDGLEDFYVGGALGQAGELFLQSETGSFSPSQSAPWDADKGQEDLGSVMFDTEGDGDLDLYVVSGGTEFPEGSANYQDRLYLNNGSGNFTRTDGALPAINFSGQPVINADYDGDGDQDLFVGGRALPGKYPYPPQSMLLQNDGGKFSNVTKTMAPDLQNAGMITDAVWTDFDGDGDLDLIVVGEWMPVRMFRNDQRIFTDVTAEYGLDSQTGWWFSITEADINKDGKMDYLLGNLGLNYKYQATTAQPFHVYASDFDENGRTDIVLGYFNDGAVYPVRGRECSSQQIPNIKSDFPTYDDFGKATLTDVYGEKLDAALHYQVKEFGSCVIMNTRSGFEIKRLPVEAQLAPINDAVSGDFNNDGHLDFVVAGNLYASEVETGRADAGLGLVLAGNGQGGFMVLPPAKNGFFAGDDAKDLALIKGQSGLMLLVANNDTYLQVYRYLSPKPH